MFSGIIQALGKLKSVETTADGKRFIIETRELREAIKIGDSIALNGCCLTVVALGEDDYSFDLTPETLNVTTLAHLKSGDFVNLECALCLGDSIDGHLVQGHVDDVAEVLGLEEVAGNSLKLTVEVPDRLAHYLIHKGSITLDGVSLTIASLKGSQLSVALIPHTALVTNLGRVKKGDKMNVEVDLFAKYTERILGPQLASMEKYR